MLSGSSGGVLNITNVQTSQGGVYTCTLVNQETKKERKESIDIKVYGRSAFAPSVFHVHVSITDVIFLKPVSITIQSYRPISASLQYIMYLDNQF